MRRPLLFVLVAIIVLLGGATAVLYQKYRQTSADYAETKTAEETARVQYTEVFSALGEIQDSLNAIALTEGSAQQSAQQMQSERPTAPDRQAALERIALLNTSIQNAKTKIRNLESRLHKNGVRISGLEKLVANLKKTVEEREANVAQLTEQVGALQTQVTGLTQEVAANQDTIRVKDQTLEERRRELGTVYYIVGSKKDLADAGVVKAKGGVLGLGKTLTMTGRVNENAFTAIDTDQETVIRTPASKVEKVKVLSPQPPGSYELRQVGGQVELHIIDPAQFRKVRHLVIMTA